MIQQEIKMRAAKQTQGFTQNRRKLFRVILAFLFSVVLALPPGANAAELFFDAKTNEFAVEQLFKADIFINTQTDDINAVEGAISWPGNLLELKEIQDSNSVINFWVERPKAQANKITFSGITPGGFQGTRGLLFSVIFLTKGNGNGMLEIKEVLALKNDGRGTPASVKILNSQFLISKNVSGFRLQAPSDTEPPETFVPLVGQDPEIFEGRYFLVFYTQDKNSGVDYYEVREGWADFIRAESPYLIDDQTLKSKIRIKAVDKAGNERIVKLPRQVPLKWYENYLVWTTIILIVVLAVYRLFKLKTKNEKVGV